MHIATVDPLRCAHKNGWNTSLSMACISDESICEKIDYLRERKKFNTFLIGLLDRAVSEGECEELISAWELTVSELVGNVKAPGQILNSKFSSRGVSDPQASGEIPRTGEHLPETDNGDETITDSQKKTLETFSFSPKSKGMIQALLKAAEPPENQ